MSQNKTGADFVVRVAARFLKDPAISSDAKALGAAHIFFVPVTGARFHHNGEIAQLIIDHVLRRGFVVSLGCQVITDHERSRGRNSKTRLSLISRPDIACARDDKSGLG